MGFKTKLNTLFDIVVVWKRKRGDEGGSRLHFCKILLSTHRDVLWTQCQSVEEHFKWIQRLLSCQAFKTLNIWKSQDGHGLNCKPPDQHVEMKHGEKIQQIFNGGDSFLHRRWRLCAWSSRFLWRTTLSQYMAWLPEWWQKIALSCSVQQRETYDHGWPT